MAKTSIIIPTYNRPSYLARLLLYYDKSGVHNEIFIADSSSEDIKTLNRTKIASFPSLNITHLDGFGDINPNHKILEVLGKVKSHFCVVCADDDFTTPESMLICEKFLEDNGDFTIAQGQYISFYPKGGNMEAEELSWKSIYKSGSILSDSPAERLREFMSNYTPTFYAMHRTGFLKMILGELKKNTKDNRFAELLASSLALIHGKMMKFDVISTARDGTSAPMVTSKNYFHYMKDFMQDGTYQERYNLFRDCLARHLMEKSGLDLDESGMIVDECMRSYFDGYKRLHGGIDGKMKYIYEGVRMPGFMKSGIRKVYRRFFIPGLDSKELRSKYSGDLARIRECVLHSTD